MVVAARDFDPATFDPQAKLLDEMHDLTLLAMVGIVDPPRPEAKLAIAEAKSAGIRVRMITGDHAVTAAAIGRELGLEGRAITGAEFAAMSDADLKEQLADISVIARVAPEDKVRLVTLLQQSGEIVAMTGDGVNDAPALKKADIGVAMGITGTEVSKQAAVMILTDDNFATIVSAVEYGRSLYNNLLKYLRFQMATLVAYIATFVGAAIFGIANGVPLGPLAILWLNFAIDIPLAIALGFDRPSSGLMTRKPRPLSAPVFTTAQWVRLVVQGLIMTVGVLAVYELVEPDSGAIVASTMLLTTLSLFHVVTGLCARDERGTVFSLAGLPGGQQLRLYGLALLLTVLATEIGFMQRILGATSLNLNQWLIAIGVALSLLVVEEVIKFFLRRPARQASAAAPASEVVRVPVAS
jgi:Ca2+-transporting ATPase